MTGIARSQRNSAKVNCWQGAVTDAQITQRLAAEVFDIAVITLTPDGHEPDDYQRAYLHNSEHLLRTWQDAGTAPGLVIFVSSSSVYPQSDGEWVTEETPAEPVSALAQQLRAAERAWQESRLNTVIVRFSGIYGPGRDFLLRQVVAGKGGPQQNSPYTNRIHADDCAGVIYHLCQRYANGFALDSIYLASDDLPATAWDVRSWLAEQLGFAAGHLQSTAASTRGGSKRCSNARLRATGYQFQWPDFRSGYGAEERHKL